LSFSFTDETLTKEGVQNLSGMEKLVNLRVRRKEKKSHELQEIFVHLAGKPPNLQKFDFIQDCYETSDKSLFVELYGKYYPDKNLTLQKMT